MFEENAKQFADYIEKNMKTVSSETKIQAQFSKLLFEVAELAEVIATNYVSIEDITHEILDVVQAAHTLLELQKRMFFSGLYNRTEDAWQKNIKNKLKKGGKYYIEG